LDSGSVDFVLWRPLVTYLEDESLEINPLAAGDLNSPAHCDPVASVELGLRGWARELRDKDERRLRKRAVRRTRMPAEGLSQVAAGLVQAAYEAGELAQDGFEDGVPLQRLKRDARFRLASLAEDAVEAVVLVEGGEDLFEAGATWDATRRLATRVFRAQGVGHTVERVLAIERLPSIPALMLRRVINWDDVLRIRDLQATRDFREWLWSQDRPDDSTTVVNAYLKALAPNIDLKDRGWFKAARVIAISVAGGLAGSAVGSAVAGVEGAAVGGALGPLVSNAIGVGASLADSFGLERILGRRSPRRFATDVLAALATRLVQEEAAGSSAPGGTEPPTGAKAGQRTV